MKTQSKKLVVGKETLKSLTVDQLGGVVGGFVSPTTFSPGADNGATGAGN
jgi:hypothetical protein